jgi:hypothetical protein
MPIESLPCKLTDDETLDRTRKLIDALSSEDALEDEKKAYVERHKIRAAAASLTTTELRGIVSTRTEYRDVEVAESLDYKRGIVEVIRTDTHDIVRTRAMSKEERQSPLFEDHSRA